MQILSIATELHSKVVIWKNNNVYSLAQMTLNITHVSGKGGYNGVMTLKLSWCVHVRSLHLCAKFHGSMVSSLGENPI